MPAQAVDTTFDVEARAAEETKVTLAGASVRLVDDPPVGALIVFTRRLNSKDAAQQVACVLELCDKWVHPDDVDTVYDAVASLHAGAELESFLETDMAALIQTVAARPTSAQSS